MNWVVKIAQDSTWRWRKILKLREEARTFIKFEVGKKKYIYIFGMVGGIQMIFIYY